MSVTPADARRWIARFDAAERADRDEKRRRGPRPDWSIAVGLSLLHAARLGARDQPLITPTRQEQVEGVRAVWDTLRSRFRS